MPSGFICKSGVQHTTLSTNMFGVRRSATENGLRMKCATRNESTLALPVSPFQIPGRTRRTQKVTGSAPQKKGLADRCVTIFRQNETIPSSAPRLQTYYDAATSFRERDTPAATGRDT